MAEAQKILTLHTSIADGVRNRLLDHIEQALTDAGATHVWIDPTTGPDLTVLAQLPAQLSDQLPAQLPDQLPAQLH